ncbi:transposase [Pseudooceanicola sp. HF7]|uniref:REP-associated tyrosine transposase n=1 Tax=Pseudooceanicola sp. HF7 TaxID=2721560 RepID=UPI00142F60FC|nr:transposase [Pseudooceanicola sp. HF7]NIZ08566.1 transposase [Pseudooceanicola sp. HF7]
MPRYLRPHIPGATIFFTVTLAERGSDLLVREVEALRTAVAGVKARRPFHIDAWVVLPDHLHCIWTLPEGDADYATRWRQIKSGFSRGRPPGPLRAGPRARHERGIWQRRFWEHHIRDEADHTAHLRYCWENPVKHGLVQRAEDWPYSSVHRDRAP